MTKRPWADANTDSSPGASSLDSSSINNTTASSEPRPQRPRHNSGPTSASVSGLAAGGSVSPRAPATATSNDALFLQNVPNISRKVKACAACRKQKVRCLMDESGPPCRRCQEKDLSCVLNKSLQTLIDERLPPSDALLHDLDMVYSSLQTVLRTLNLPAQGPLQSTKSTKGHTHTPVSVDPPDPEYAEDAGPSCDNSPKLKPEDDRDLPRVPIQSVYHLTKLRALRSPEASHDSLRPGQPDDNAEAAARAGDDLISRGLLQLPDAERLFRLYTDHLDHYMYNVGARYSSLAALRRASPILTAVILTVGAQHDPASNHIYPVCNREFRRLMTASLFDRRVDRDHLRALCIATYWLNDASWVLSGLAARRAASFGIASQFRRLVQRNDEDAADFVRIWYLIYICDQHLSTLYGRECTTKEDAAVQGWELMVKATTTTTGDLRLISQVALLIIIHNIRELFGSDADKPIPTVFLTQIKDFARQLDQWVGHWSTTFPEYQENFGTFPRKGALFHFQFAKLYLYSHVFRGLRHSAVPAPFLEAARGAASAAVSILNMILADDDVRRGLVGLPCYIQSMIGFACMFLARLTAMYGDDMVERAVAVDLISRLVVVYRATPVGRWHLVPLMADGLEKMVGILRQQPDGPRGAAAGGGGGQSTGQQQGGGAGAGSGGPLGAGANEQMAAEAMYDLSAAGGQQQQQQPDFSTMNLDPHFLMDPSVGMGMGMGMGLGLGATPGQPFFGDEFGFGQGLM